jgi:hypothetical protein
MSLRSHPRLPLHKGRIKPTHGLNMLTSAALVCGRARMTSCKCGSTARRPPRRRPSRIAPVAICAARHGNDFGAPSPWRQ